VPPPPPMALMPSREMPAGTWNCWIEPVWTKTSVTHGDRMTLPLLLFEFSAATIRVPEEWT
jgi:hypothetical protein